MNSSEEKINNTTSSDTEHDCELQYFVIYTLILAPICIFGFVGNTVSVIVLRKEKSQRVANLLLLCLAVVDNLFLALAFGVLSICHGLSLSGQTGQRIAYFATPFANVLQLATIWITLLIAINRHIAVCKPFKARSLNTIRAVKTQVTIVLILSFLSNLMRFFQYKVDLKTLDMHIIHDPSSTTWKIYETVYTSVAFILPLILLAVINIRIIMKVRQRILTPSYGRGKSEGHCSSLTYVMIIIVIQVLVCHTPDRIQMIILSVWEIEQDCHTPISVIMGVNNILVITNSATNFIIYYVVRKSFRVKVQKLLCK